MLQKLPVHSLKNFYNLVRLEYNQQEDLIVSSHLGLIAHNRAESSIEKTGFENAPICVRSFPKHVYPLHGGGTRVLENYGHKWAHFQTQFFQSNSQPYYALLSPDGKTLLNPPVGYTPDEQDYKSFLDCGLEAFEALSPPNYK